MNQTNSNKRLKVPASLIKENKIFGFLICFLRFVRIITLFLIVLISRCT